MVLQTLIDVLAENLKRPKLSEEYKAKLVTMTVLLFINSGLLVAIENSRLFDNNESESADMDSKWYEKIGQIIIET